MNVSGLLSMLNQGARAGASRQSDELKVSGHPAIDPAEPAGVNTAVDTYHGTDDPVSERLLARSGVDAYVQLSNIPAIDEKYEKSRDLLINGVAVATVSLKKAYIAAMSQLSTGLQRKDWSFSVSDGNLVFTEGDDALTEQDLADLRKAFDSVKTAANELADAVVASIELRREVGESSGNLGWGRFDVNETNFSDVVDLREYVTAVLPGGKYNMNCRDRTNYWQLDTVISGIAMMDQIASARTLSSK